MKKKIKRLMVVVVVAYKTKRLGTTEPTFLLRSLTLHVKLSMSLCAFIVMLCFDGK